MRAARIGKELSMLAKEPLPGIAVWPGAKGKDEQDSMDVLHVRLKGPEGSPYHGAAFELSVHLPKNYPLQPPSIKFTSPIYHPNISKEGLICLDSLKMPPEGAWRASLNIGQVLLQIRLLLVEPNPDDPLMPEISDLYRNDREAFFKRARSEANRLVKRPSSSGESIHSSGDKRNRTQDLANVENTSLSVNKVKKTAAEVVDLT